MSLLHERIQFFSTRNPTPKDFQEMVNGAKRLEEQNRELRKIISSQNYTLSGVNNYLKQGSSNGVMLATRMIDAMNEQNKLKEQG